MAAGAYYTGALPGFVVEEENGVWGAAQPITGLSPLTGGSGVSVHSVSCASPGNCAVAGSLYAPYPASGDPHLLRGFVVSETNGVWGSADILAPPVTAAKLGAGKLQSVSCSAPGDCLAGGYDSTDYQTTEAEVIEETNGTWGAPTLIPGAPAFDQVESVSCTVPGDCVAGLGSTHTGSAAALVTESGGTWSVQAVPGLSALATDQEYSSIESVSCPSTGDCTAAGEFTTPGNGGRLFVLTEQDGIWGQASEFPQGPEFAGVDPAFMRGAGRLRTSLKQRHRRSGERVVVHRSIGPVNPGRAGKQRRCDHAVLPVGGKLQRGRRGLRGTRYLVRIRHHRDERHLGPRSPGTGHE